MYKIGKEFYIIKTNLQIVKIKICKIIITENDIRYDYTYADDKIHFNSLWNANYLRNNGKLLKFKTEKQAKKYIKKEELKMNNIEIVKSEEIEKYFMEIFNEIHKGVSDYDTLLVGTRILEIARDRLDNDLDNKEIEKEYYKLNNIINDLHKIIEEYV